jgi:phosphopantetheinyl transferase
MGRIARPVGARVIWQGASLAGLPPGDAVWLARLDDPAVADIARRAPLCPEDLRDLADRPQAAMRALRRQLTKVLLAHAAQCHPDVVVLGRTAAGAPMAVSPNGWHVSVAGRWPHALIGVSRAAVGVDLEPLNALPPPDDALTPQERVEATTAPERLRRWVAKEAHAKALGVAAQIDPADIHTQADGDTLRVHSAQGRTLCQIRQTGHTLCAVARLIV